MYRVNIGSIANELLPFCKLIELKNIKNCPYLRALLTNANGFTETYLYIIQLAEDRYSLCETDDETSLRYLPMNSYCEPFILERDMINRIIEGKRLEIGDDEIVKDLTFLELIRKIYSILIDHKIIDMTLDRLNLQIRALEFPTFRLIRALENIGGDNCRLIDCLIAIKDPFNRSSLEGIKGRDVGELLSKFNQLGIALNISNKIITDFNFKRISLPKFKGEDYEKIIGTGKII